MRSNKRLHPMFSMRLVVVGILLGALWLSACAKPAAPTPSPSPAPKPLAPVKGGTGVFLLYWEAPLSNPVLSQGGFGSTLLFDPLLQLDENGQFQGRLAEKWVVSPDGLTYTFTLRKNVKWHDGKPFTSADVKFTYDTIMDSKTLGTLKSTFSMKSGGTITCDAPDANTVKFVLPKTFAPFLGKLSAVRMIPKHLYEGKDVNSSDYNHKPVGTGAFKFQERKAGEYGILVRNDDYFFPVYLDKVVLRVIPDSTASAAAFEKKEIDFCWVDAADVEKYSKAPGVVEYPIDMGISAFLWLNVKNPLFSNKEVRQAIAYAIDKEDIAKTVTYGLSKGSYNIYTPNGPHAFWFNPDAPKYQYNVEKAKQILDKLGWKPGADGVRVKDGVKLSFVHYGQTGFAEYEKVNTMLQSQLAKVGIKMEIRLLEPAAFQEKLRSKEDPRPMDSHLTGFSPERYDPDWTTVFHSSEYPGGWNTYGYSSKEADKLLEQGITTVDKEARKKIYFDLQKVIMEDVPYIPIYEYRPVFGVLERIQGLPSDHSKDASTVLWYFPERLSIKPAAPAK